MTASIGQTAAAEPASDVAAQERRTKLLVFGSLNHIHVMHPACTMRDLGFDVTVAGDVNPLYPEPTLESEGIRTIESPRVSHSSPAGVLAHVRWARHVYREVRPDVTHAHWLCGFAAFAALAGVKPLVVMAWGSDVLRASRVHDVANRIALRRSTAAIALSQQIEDRMLRLGARPEQIVRLVHGADTDRFVPRPDGREGARRRLGLGKNRIVLGARSLFPLYNPRVIVDAFEEVARSISDVDLVLLHLGVETPEIGPLHERVRLVGMVPHEHMPDYFRAADVCVSVPSSDGSPRTVWEAMAAGAPLVLSDLPWLHGIIESGREALIVPIEAKAIADAIRRILQDPDLASGLAARGRELVVNRYSYAREMGRLADLLRSVAQRA
jgi:glycosyltransferase involved in cell wall biosynthesis